MNRFDEVDADADAATEGTLPLDSAADSASDEPPVALKPDDLAPSLATRAEQLLAQLVPSEREAVIAEMQGRTPAQQEEVLMHVEEMLMSEEDDERVPSEEELSSMWAQVFDIVSEDDRAEIEKALEGRSLAERFDIYQEVEQQLANSEDGPDMEVSPPRRGDAELEGVNDNLQPLSPDELKARWALAYEKLCEADRQALLGLIDEQNAVGQTRLLLAIEEQLDSHEFVPGESILEGGDDELDELGDDESARMADAEDTIRTMMPAELEDEFKACFEMLLDRTDDTAEAKEDASRLQAEWSAAAVEQKRELLMQMVFCLNNPQAATADGAGSPTSAAVAHEPQKLGDSVSVHRRGGDGSQIRAHADDATDAIERRKRAAAGRAKAAPPGSVGRIAMASCLAVVAFVAAYFAYSRLRVSPAETMPMTTWTE
jgi:hypothetical protein